jgi:cytoskeletal protein RodZ
MLELPKQRRSKKRLIIGAIVALFIIVGLTGNGQSASSTQNNAQPTQTQTQQAQPVTSVTPTASKAGPAPQQANSASTQSASTAKQAPTPAPAPAAQQTLSNNNTYTNSSGNTVHSPATTSDGSVPAGATAQCRDGSYSFSQHRNGTCSGHGGVASWL